MSRTFNELTINHNEEQSTPAPPSPSNKSLKSHISKLALIRNLSVTSEKDPFTVLTIHQVLILVCSIILMIVVLQIPTILYFNSTAPSSARSTFTSQIDFRTCSVSNYHMAGKFDGEFNLTVLTFITPIIKLISVNVNFPDTMQNGLLSFLQIKICHNIVVL